MTIKLDLSTKPQKIVSIEERKSNKYVVIFFFLTLIYVSSVFQFSVLFFNLYDISGERAVLNDEITKKENKLALVSSNIKELNDKINGRTKDIEFVLGSVPVPEIITSLYEYKKNGVNLEYLAAQEGKIIITGSCTGSEGLDSLSETLVKNQVVKEAPVPEFSGSGRNNASRIFKIEEKILSYSGMMDGKGLN